jgi:curli biogenesis system outer membrane secretion channel CsgG
VLAFSSLRKQPAAITTLLVSILFALFAYENLSAILDTAEQRFATLSAIQRTSDTADLQIPRATIQLTLHPASYGSTKTTHLVSDALTIAGLWAMELRRRRVNSAPATA